MSPVLFQRYYEGTIQPCYTTGLRVRPRPSFQHVEPSTWSYDSFMLLPIIKGLGFRAANVEPCL